MSKKPETLADRVRRAVYKTGLSQAEFARQAKIKLRTLQDVLGGKSTNPERATLQGISVRSGVSIDELVTGTALAEPEKPHIIEARIETILAKHEERLKTDSDYRTLHNISEGRLKEIDRLKHELATSAVALKKIPPEITEFWKHSPPRVKFACMYLLTENKQFLVSLSETLRADIRTLARALRPARKARA